MRPLLVSFFVAALLPASLVRTQDGSFDCAGVRLHYRSTGDGIPLVLLSGGPGFDIAYMLPVTNFVPSGYRAILFEQRGTGRSRPAAFDPTTLTLQGAVADLEALRLHMKQERLTMLGHSWGGMLAMAYAAAHPDHVDRLILVGSGGPTLEFAQWFGDNIEARLHAEDIALRDSWTAAAKTGVDPGKVAIERMRAMTPGYFFDRKLGQGFAAELKQEQYYSDVNQRLFGEMSQHYDLREGLAKLQRPTLILQGHQDPMGDKTAEQIRTAITGSTLVSIRRCGHFPWLEQPEQFRKAIAEFLRAPPK